MEIGRQLPPEWNIVYASYGTGYRTFQQAGVPCIDMGLPDANSTADTTVLAGRITGHVNPDVVIAHEEFAALPAAKIFGKPTVMITDFFTSPEMYSMATLKHADCILFPGIRGVFDEPATAAGRVTYVKPVLRSFAFRRRDRAKAREELGLPRDACVIAVLPGSWTEEMAPIREQVERSFAALRPVPKHLVWQDPGTYDPQPDRLMVAADLAITKCNRITVYELASLGIRTLSIRHGGNPADERAIAGLPCNRNISRLTPRVLREALGSPEPRPMRWAGRSCANELARWIQTAHFDRPDSQRGR